MKLTIKYKPLNILHADDDLDDRFFFEKALKSLPFSCALTCVENGELLMKKLLRDEDNLPDILFLDYNMPRKNGFECLCEIKQHPKLKKLPVVICSTYLHEEVADTLYKQGAHFYLRKADLPDLKEILNRIFTLMVEKKFNRPLRKQFILTSLQV